MAQNIREQALFNLAIDSKLRGCDLVKLKVCDVAQGGRAYGTHTMRRTKATLIYRRTKNLRAVQLLLGHTKLESTVRYLGIEVDDALEISEQTEI
jgi:site-specific recombinase XerC